MKHLKRINLKNEKGNAMILALSVILILTTFASVSLMTSVANVQMSGRYKEWSNGYYALDKNAELRLNQLNILLEKAEKDAQAYMTGQFYLSDNPADPDIPNELRLASLGAQSYIHSQWQTNKQNFMNDTFKRLYCYYASYMLNSEQFTLDHKKKYIITYLDDPTAGYVDYQSALFDSLDSNYNDVLSEGNLSVIIDTKNPTDPKLPVDPNDPIPIDPNTINGKNVSVKINVVLPNYEVLPNKVAIKGNPVWTSAITTVGSIGFEGNGTSIINGDLFSADKDESLYLNDNEVETYGIYSNGSDVKINGNVYSKGNLHILGSDSKIDVHPYSNINDAPSFTIDLKNKVFSNNGLFFDNDTAEYPTPTPLDYTYIQDSLIDPTDQTLYFVNQDVTGGNIYCNSLVVDQGVSYGEINAYGNVSTFNDIKMNNSYLNSNGSNSKILVSKNYIGINSEGHNGDPNASSTVINNTALSGNTITLQGKVIVPGTAFAQYKGIKPDGATSFDWSDHLYYQTGESITAKNDAIYSAYMAPLKNPYPGYDYVFDQYTNDDPNDDPNDETNISAYYLMRQNNTDGYDPENKLVKPKMSQLADYLGEKIAKNLSGKPITNIFYGSSVEGYSLGLALLHSSEATTATVYGPTFPNIPSDHQPQAISDIDTLYYNHYMKFRDSLSKIFLSKVQNLGTVKNMPISFENFVDKSLGYIANSIGYVDKSAVLDTNGTLLSGVRTVPSETPNSFVYIQQTADSTYTLNLGNYSGIIYSEGNLNITSGSFSGAIICEGNINVEDTVAIEYNKEVIQNVLESEDIVYRFFSKLICFENPADKSLGFVDKSIVLDINGSLSSEIKSDPSGMQNSFVYLQQTSDSTYDLTTGDYSGILYCEGNLNITGNVSFNGAIICEGNVTISGDPTITYDEIVIQSILVEDVKARQFFAPGAMGEDTKVSTTGYKGAAYRKDGIHFKIVEWKEVREI